MLKRDPSIPLEEQIKDPKGNPRYYTKEKDFYKINETDYIVTKEWQKDQRQSGIALLIWILDKINYSHNLIIFGAPGTGKSHLLEEERELLLAQGGNYERVTFHPDYSYANFVGTYKPVPKKDEKKQDAISYEYVPGPFIRVLVDALNHKDKPYLLLIEEINRANVAAVFGDVFQLLDRKADGESEYPVAPSEDLKKYLKDHVEGDQSFDELTIPSNMFIWATMNSADQGVFPMDTAFKRRWDFEYIGINKGENDISDQVFELGTDEKRKIEWNVLRRAINEILSDQRINEDKLLGPFFIADLALVDGKKKEITNDRFIEIFENKVLMYLFEDAAKQRRNEVFNSEKVNVNRYSSICDGFEKYGVSVFKNIDTYITNVKKELGKSTETEA